jgi:hypothetical protein
MRIAILMLCALLAPGAAADAAETAEPLGAAHLSETLGLQPSSQPVRERPGWHTPHIILVAPALHELVPQLQQVAPGVKILEVSAATPREVASRRCDDWRVLGRNTRGREEAGVDPVARGRG